MKRFNRYEFKSDSELVKGEKPAFFELLIDNVNKDSSVLDIGCGSGELALKLSSYCKKIVGVDCYARYISTANKDKQSKKIKNISFKIADARKLPFKDKSFDLVYSSRGPLSAGADFLKEALRVLKKGGLLLEETIGETDKIELKRIFKRGQNFPYVFKKQTLVKKLLDQFGVELVYLKNFVYYQKFSSLSAVVKVLERTPIIPDFNRRQDQESLRKLSASNGKKGIILSAHRLWWIGQKRK
jgi:ubiquinone/menaquinone biosynthesis C-methylase UbiE